MEEVQKQISLVLFSKVHLTGIFVLLASATLPAHAIGDQKGVMLMLNSLGITLDTTIIQGRSSKRDITCFILQSVPTIWVQMLTGYVRHN